MYAQHCNILFIVGYRETFVSDATGGDRVCVHHHLVYQSSTIHRTCPQDQHASISVAI